MTKIAIVGAGPAGLFAAYMLADIYDVTLFEAGKPIEERKCPEIPECSCKRCDILEGDGGAGGFSDGKNTYSLQRGTQLEQIFRDEDEGYLAVIDNLFLSWGIEGRWYNPLKEIPPAFTDSLLEFGSYPLRHVGSDGIQLFVSKMMKHLRDHHIEIVREPVLDISVIGDEVKGVEVPDRFIEYDHVVLAAGLQGIPWVDKLMSRIGSPMRSGPAGFGIRFEALDRLIAPLHEMFYDFKIVYEHPETGIVLRSFCCNHQGSIVNENHKSMGIINVNGHSYLDPKRRTQRSNMAIIAKIPEEFAKAYEFESPQDLIWSQGKNVNRRAHGHTAYQPALEFLYGSQNEFLDHRTNHQCQRADIRASILAPLGDAFSRFIQELHLAVPIVTNSSVIYAPEIKYVGRRANIDLETWRSKDLTNMHIVGACSGYLDSFISAAVSGIVAAQDIIKKE